MYAGFAARSAAVAGVVVATVGLIFAFEKAAKAFGSKR